jgi:hypothetical protein
MVLATKNGDVMSLAGPDLGKFVVVYFGAAAG